MISFSEDEKDAVQEVFNVGIGASAAALSEMVGEEVLLSVPELQLLSPTGLAERLGESSSRTVCGVSQEFSGGQGEGTALLLFPEGQSLELVRVLMGREQDQSEFTELEEEALTEVGNIILNACLSSLANMMGTELDVKLPAFAKGLRGDLLGQGVVDDAVILLMIHFALEERAIDGELAFMLELNSLRGMVNNAFGQMVS